MARYQDKYHESGLAAQVDSIRKTAKRFDETTLAAADSIRDAEMRFLEETLEHADAEAMYDDASAAAPHAAGVVTLLSNLDGLSATMQGALPELVNDTNIARIADALRFIDNELNYYFADSDTVHLANALDTGLQNFHQALRRSFGYWQMGRGPNQMGRNPEPVADFDLRPERRQTFASKLLGNLEDWVPGSVAEIRGSMGSGTADDYSDIDICWV